MKKSYMFCSPQLCNAQYMPKIFFTPTSMQRHLSHRNTSLKGVEARLLCIAVKQLQTAKSSRHTIPSKSYQHDFDMPQTAATLNMYKPNPSCQLNSS